MLIAFFTIALLSLILFCILLSIFHDDLKEFTILSIIMIMISLITIYGLLISTTKIYLPMQIHSIKYTEKGTIYNLDKEYQQKIIINTLNYDLKPGDTLDIRKLFLSKDSESVR